MKNEFSTRTEAEKHIAERGQAGRKKARRVGSQWYLVKNETGGINRSLFVEVYKVACKKAGRSLRDIVKINCEAHALYDSVKRGLK